MRLKITTLALFLLFIVTGCASSPNEMAASYVSPLIYQSYDCQQLVMESDRVSRRVQSMHAKLDEKESDDSAKMAVGLILFWPALFFLDGDEDGAIEYKRLKGESEAIHQAAIARKCDLKLLVPPMPKEVKKTEEEKLADKKTKEERCQQYGEC
ncbi:uncharacterized protein METZ01_LOCUS331358 [marine metagenome]|uniref:Metal ABC transporter ATP-binding protein n=1 Tax=marine metagenome TaxID=408172 RepID=A0A382PYT5_9ZZZZ